MPRVKQFNEEQVLEKAMELFWKKGFHATSMQDLVDHLGINRASLYDTFGGKKALFDRAFQRYRRNNTDLITHLLSGEESVKNGLGKLFELSAMESLNDADHKGCFVVNTTTELIPEYDDIRLSVEANRKNFEKIFYDYLKKGVEKGELSAEKDLKALSTFLFTLYNGLKVVAKSNPSEQEVLSTIRTALSVLD